MPLDKWLTPRDAHLEREKGSTAEIKLLSQGEIKRKLTKGRTIHKVFQSASRREEQEKKEKTDAPYKDIVNAKSIKENTGREMARTRGVLKTNTREAKKRQFSSIMARGKCRSGLRVHHSLLLCPSR